MKSVIILVVGVAVLTGETITVASRAQYADALKKARPGDTLSLAPGTYTNAAPPAELDGTLENPIVVKGAGKDKVILEGTMKHYARHWTFEDVHFDGNGAQLIIQLKPGAIALPSMAAWVTDK